MNKPQLDSYTVNVKTSKSNYRLKNMKELYRIHHLECVSKHDKRFISIIIMVVTDIIC